MIIKYYIQLNNKNKISQIYSDEGGFEVPPTAIEVTYETIKDYLKEKNKGFNVYYNNGELSTVYPHNEPEYILEQKVLEIKDLLSSTDTTQLLDNRLSETKREEFANYRQQLRNIIQDIEDGVVGVEVGVPEKPSYN